VKKKKTRWWQKKTKIEKKGKGQKNPRKPHEIKKNTEKEGAVFIFLFYK